MQVKRNRHPGIASFSPLLAVPQVSFMGFARNNNNTTKKCKEEHQSSQLIAKK